MNHWFGSRGLLRCQVLGVVLLFCAVHSLAGAQELSPMEKIKARGALRVAVYKNNPPYSSGPVADMRGLDVSLAEALATKLHLRLALLPFDAGENMNDDLRNMVWKGHYLGYGPADVMIHVPVDRYLANENKQALIFGAYTRELLVVLHDPGKIASVRTPEDLVNKRIGVESGAGAASMLMGYQGGLLRDRISIFKDGVDAAKMVVDGQLDAAYVSRAQAEAAIYSSGAAGKGKLDMSPLALPTPIAAGWLLGLAVKADNKELAVALESALAQLRQSGELLRIFTAHGLTLVMPQSAETE